MKQETEAAREKRLLRMKEYVRKNRDRIREYQRIYRHENREKIAAQKRLCEDRKSEHYRAKKAQWAAANRDKVREIQKKYYAGHKEDVAKYLREYSKANRWRNQDKIAWMKCKRANRVPPWVRRKAIQEVYSKCPESLDVDHIIPLHGQNVSGLHVPWNLQYLTKAENSRKGTRV